MSGLSTLQYVWRFLVGGLVVVFVTYLSKTDRPILAGLAILFPTITLTSYFIIGYGQGVSQVREAIPASAIALVGYFVLFPVMYFSTYYTNIYGVILLSLVSWVAVTLILLKLGLVSALN